MAISATQALDAFNNAFDTGDTSKLADMLSDNFIFKHSDQSEDNRTEVLEWANKPNFTIGDYQIFHEDEHVICGVHSVTEENKPNRSLMFFGKFENGKCTFWKIHGYDTE